MLVKFINIHFLKTGLIVFLLLTFLSCHQYFNNPVDPEATDYIGYEVTLESNKVTNQQPLSGEEVVYPAVVWSQCLGNVLYAYEIASDFSFSGLSLVSTAYDLLSNSSALFQYNSEKSWPTVGEENLWALPVGTYWWRANVKGEATLNEWGDWSYPQSFIQKLRMTEMYWKQDEDSTYKQGFRYYFDLYGFSEKEISFVHFNSEENMRELESIVTLYNESKQPTFERIYSDIECSLESLVEVRQFYYELGFDSRIEYRLKVKSQKNGESIDPPVKMEIEYFTYATEESKEIISIERYLFNEEGGERLYFLSQYLDGKQIRTSFFIEDPSDSTKVIMNYYYDLYYLEDYPEKPSRAEYYMLDNDSGLLEYYNDYLIDYNFPSDDGGQVIYIGGNSRSIGKSTHIQDVNNSFTSDLTIKKIQKPVWISLSN